MLAQNYNLPSPEPWMSRLYGDFNCDGVCDFDDLTLLAQLYNVDLT